ncbi:MAG TPA: DUF5995 family protein [Thermoanaerobaculia bacterium]
MNSIDDVIARMRALDAALPETDGLKWWNLLYLRVTEAVKNHPPAGGWQDPQWLERLDVIFAGLYFDAVRDPEGSRVWRPLFRARFRRDVARVQFALAGMNAHINHDFAPAILRACVERGIEPRRGTPQHHDFEHFNELLERVQGDVKDWLLTGVFRHVDGSLGRLDDVLAMWKVQKARETAWSNAEILWELRPLPTVVTESFMRSVRRLVELSSKGLLVPTR